MSRVWLPRMHGPSRARGDGPGQRRRDPADRGCRGICTCISPNRGNRRPRHRRAKAGTTRPRARPVIAQCVPIRTQVGRKKYRIPSGVARDADGRFGGDIVDITGVLLRTVGASCGVSPGSWPACRQNATVEWRAFAVVVGIAGLACHPREAAIGPRSAIACTHDKARSRRGDGRARPGPARAVVVRGARAVERRSGGAAGRPRWVCEATRRARPASLPSPAHAPLRPAARPLLPVATRA
jgi:hypothetical protein